MAPPTPSIDLTPSRQAFSHFRIIPLQLGYAVGGLVAPVKGYIFIFVTFIILLILRGSPVLIQNPHLPRRQFSKSQLAMASAKLKDWHAERAKERQKLSKGRGKKGPVDLPDLLGKSENGVAAGNEAMKLAFRANEASETMVPMTFVDYAEFIWQHDGTQQEVAEVLGWKPQKVKEYSRLKKVENKAWAVIVESFSNSTHEVEISTLFSEGLLRPIINLTPKQQLTVAHAFVKVVFTCTQITSRRTTLRASSTIPRRLDKSLATCS